MPPRPGKAKAFVLAAVRLERAASYHVAPTSSGLLRLARSFIDRALAWGVRP